MGLEESEERVEESESPGEVTDEEFDELLQAVYLHGETAREKTYRSRGPHAQRDMDAADDAVDYIVRTLLKERAQYGNCTRWKANWGYFSWCWGRRIIDQYRRQIIDTSSSGSPVRNDSDASQGSLNRFRRVQVEDWNDPPAAVTREWQRTPEQLAAVLSPIYVELIPRVVKVLGQRSESETARRTKLTPQQLEAVRFELAAGGGLAGYVDEEQEAFLDALPHGGAHWRRDLALRWRQLDPETTSIDQSAVTRALKRGVEQIRLCMYLFTTLAPRHDAVTKEIDMDHLLDILDRPQGVRLPRSERLESAERKRLRIAGETCVPHQDDFIVDAEAYLGKALGQESGNEEARRIGLEALHASEERFAMLVPEQASPPQFSCVLHCPTHTPTSNDRES